MIASSHLKIVFSVIFAIELNHRLIKISKTSTDSNVFEYFLESVGKNILWQIAENRAKLKICIETFGF